jgi:hypothetical protein
MHVTSTNFMNILTNLIYLRLKKMNYKNKFGKGDICCVVISQLKKRVCKKKYLKSMRHLMTPSAISILRL